MYKSIHVIMRKLFSVAADLFFSSNPVKINQTCLNNYTQLVWESEHVGRKIKLHLFDRAERKYFMSTIKAGATCIDVGANIGFYTNIFSYKAGVGGQVIAVEPIKRNCKLIELNLEINKNKARTSVECAAIADVGDIDVEYSVCNDSAYSGVKLERKDDREITSALNENGEIRGYIHVHTLTIDGLATKYNLEKIDVLKIVVEGFVYKALLGARETLASPSMRPSIVMAKVVEQQLNYYGATAKDIYTYMESFGYRKKTMTREGRLVDLADLSIVESKPNVFFVAEN
mgnify:CR=1 FL=1